MPAEQTLITLLLVLTLGLVIPELLRKFRLPAITLIILSGAMFGPHGFDIIAPNETIEFFGFLGMAFLMFTAGIETDLGVLKKKKFPIFIMALINGLIPFAVGAGITYIFGYSFLTSVLVGIIFISSSVAIIVPSMRANKRIDKLSAQMILSAVMVADMISLVALGFFFQSTNKIANLPLPIYFVILVGSIVALLYFIPRISSKVLKRRFLSDGEYERQLRFVLLVLIGTLTFFILLGVHPILASFLAGVSLSHVVQGDKKGILYKKLHTLGFGLFVPVFFFIVGMEMDLLLFKEFDVGNLFMIFLIVGLMGSKFLSGFLAGKIVHMSQKSSLFYGSISMTQLTTTLAVTYAAESIGLLDTTLVTTIILLSIITTVVGPMLASYVSRAKL
jgi:Kef-type K+ transport system membrane component KefB